MDNEFEHLFKLEEKLLLPFTRLDLAELQTLIAPDFVEVGDTGQVYDRDEIFAVLQAEIPTGIYAKDFKATPLSPDTVLITYKTSRTKSFSNGAIRSSIWTNKNGHWQTIYHQATVYMGT